MLLRKSCHDLPASNEIQTPFSVPAEVEIGVYRIGQETLTNALRHAQPQQIIIELHYMQTQLRLRIQDNGQGFDLHQRQEGIGLAGMQERAARMGGELTIASQPGQGTEVTFKFPIAQPPPHRGVDEHPPMEEAEIAPIGAVR